MKQRAFTSALHRRAVPAALGALGVLGLIAVGTTTASAAPLHCKPTIVLEHGAWANGSSARGSAPTDRRGSASAEVNVLSLQAATVPAGGGSDSGRYPFGWQDSSQAGGGGHHPRVSARAAARTALMCSAHSV